MTSGPQHYVDARSLANEAVEEINEASAADSVPMEKKHLDRVVALAATAQVHATLALAAATARNDGQQGMTFDERADWRDVTRPAN